jgi:hypothetical protein
MKTSESLKHFAPAFRKAQSEMEAVKKDKSKIIYGGGGNRVNSEHEVWPRFTCDNHTTNTELQPDTVRISRECALEALHAMQNDQARPDFQCGELNEAIGQLKQALEKGE